MTGSRRRRERRDDNTALRPPPGHRMAKEGRSRGGGVDDGGIRGGSISCWLYTLVCALRASGGVLSVYLVTPLGAEELDYSLLSSLCGWLVGNTECMSVGDKGGWRVRVQSPAIYQSICYVFSHRDATTVSRFHIVLIFSPCSVNNGESATHVHRESLTDRSGPTPVSTDAAADTAAV